MSVLTKKSMKINKNWEAELASIDDESNLKHTIFREHHETFNSVVSILDKKLKDLEPSVRMYRKRRRIGSIFCNVTKKESGLYSIKLYMVHDMTEVITNVAKSEGKIELSTNHKTKWSHRKGRLMPKEFYKWMENVLNCVLIEVTQHSDTMNRIFVSITKDNMELLVRRRGRDSFVVKVIPALRCTVCETMDECVAAVGFIKGKPKTWRLKYNTREIEFMSHPSFNTSLRMVKLIRETHDMSYIPKSMIKIILIMALNDDNNQPQQHKSNVQILGIVLEKFQRAIADKELVDMLDDEYTNVIRNFDLSDEQLADCQRKLGEILKRFSDNKDSIRNITLNIPKGKRFPRIVSKIRGKNPPVVEFKYLMNDVDSTPNDECNCGLRNIVKRFEKVKIAKKTGNASNVKKNEIKINDNTLLAKGVYSKKGDKKKAVVFDQKSIGCPMYSSSTDDINGMLMRKDLMMAPKFGGSCLVINTIRM